MRRLIGFDRDKKAPDSTVILPYDQRQKSRLLVTLENDEEVGIFCRGVRFCGEAIS